MGKEASQSQINDVSDTALWVASYRAEETSRPDALFRDPLALKLVGERGRKIAESMHDSTARYTRWTVIIRTCIIDQLIQEHIARGVDTIVNLGAGLDTRPYRMSLPASLNWIEIDFPHMIAHKEKLLEKEKPSCQLERISHDLSNREQRQKLFASIGSRSKKTLIITEGVIPYLTPGQVAELAEDLLAHKSFQFWIGEYISPQVYRYLRTPARQQKMKNAPFLFFPPDWLGFFKEKGWEVHEIRYLAEESKKLGRTVPMPWWARVIQRFIPQQAVQKYQRFSGFVVFTPSINQH